uniref:HAT C-terminal dimerisation domain-containing protein n=1 Tax=Fagus sylvatica TaxID=28930 RepID=A0A2N9ED94_FAGSY
MSTHETMSSSNPSSSSTPIGSSESPLTVDEDNGTPCSSPLTMNAQIDGQTENEDVEGIGKLKSSMWSHFKKRKIDGVFKADGLSVIGPCIEKVRESVGFWTASTKRRQRFEETRQQLHIECTKELALDCKTRWNSTYLMLSVAIEYQDVFFRLKQRESAYNCMPSEEDWEIASDICKRLSVFYKVTEVFSGTSYPTANLFFPKVCEIKIALNLWFTSPNDMIRSMAFRMLEKFDSYWNVIHGVMAVATILDPRYKIELLEYYFPIIYGDQADDEIQRIRDICYEMLRDYNSGRMGKEANRGTCANEDVMAIDDSLVNFDNFVSQKKKANGPKYPTLQRIARDILAIPVSTVASESAFSTSGRLLSPHRSKLHPKTVEALMCAQNWLWAGIKGTSSTKEEDMDIQNILDDYDDEDESGVTRVEESGNS